MRQRRYREELDRKLFSRAWKGKQWKVIVTVRSYAGGKPRLLLSREKISNKYRNRPFAKLGHLTKEEAAGILPILQEAITHMK